MTTLIDHNYPLPNEMLVVDETDEPIQGAVIRIFELTKFQAGDISDWVGETITDIEGKWVDPIALEDGRTWIVHIQKETMYGPKHIEITT